MKMKRIVALLLIAAMLTGTLIACGSKTGEITTVPAGDTIMAAAAETITAVEPKVAGDGSIYYLNFRPEQVGQRVALGEAYTAEIGVSVIVVTAAFGIYERTLGPEMAKGEIPTLFQVNGPVGLVPWKGYYCDLKDNAAYKDLSSDDSVLIDESGAVKGIAYIIETYGLIHSKKPLNNYVAMDEAVISSTDEINDFDTLRAVADDIQAKKDDLRTEGVFVSTGFDPFSDWRFKTHLANLFLYYGYKMDGIFSTDAVKGAYLGNYRVIFDLYITDATCESTLLSGKTGEDAVSEFTLGEVVFHQNGTWAYNDIKDNGVAGEDPDMMPIYIGAEGEEKWGLCTGSKNYWCVNNKASKADIQIALDFLQWVAESETGRASFIREVGFVTPFTTFTEEYLPANPLVAVADADVKKSNTAAFWNLITVLSGEWKNVLESALFEYAQDTGVGYSEDRVRGQLGC